MQFGGKVMQVKHDYVAIATANFDVMVAVNGLIDGGESAEINSLHIWGAHLWHCFELLRWKPNDRT